jgi:hypothetical protein
MLLTSVLMFFIKYVTDKVGIAIMLCAGILEVPGLSLTQVTTYPGRGLF